VPESAVLHDADWHWLDLARDRLKREESIETLAHCYWRGVRTSEGTVIEWLVSSARVVRELEVSEQEREDFRDSRAGTTAADIAAQFKLGG